MKLQKKLFKNKDNANRKKQQSKITLKLRRDENERIDNVLGCVNICSLFNR
ncbi:hypothetical protein CCAND38_310030 [Capnocytophaga canis]|uniref:Uncharacterized protein n=1 Tax=Capnocytophaga canis TaxID=1848903 RepID=A0A0B7I846_9FLAO|nr:hypothetical protein CCAND38_310030 [Capnocytophaga canis]CEN51368.1 hypothetical protein CCAND93_160012 [Capnocytophaga canis]